MKHITNPKYKIPAVVESDVDKKAVITVMSKYASRGIFYIGIAHRRYDGSICWLGFEYNTRNANSPIPDHSEPQEWVILDPPTVYLINLLIYDWNTYQDDVYFLILENGDDYNKFKEMFPNVNVNIQKEIIKHLGGSSETHH